MNLRTVGAVLFTLIAGLSAAQAQVVTKTIAYEHNGVQLEGYLAEPAKVDGKLPGVLVVHEWWGLNDNTRRRTKMLAELGYVAFAADMYGKGKVTTDPKQAGAWSGAIKADPVLGRARVGAALNVLAQQEHADPQRLAAIGYCFGGTTVLELAYSGANIRGVVSFHGGLTEPKPEDDPNIKAKILVCTGADDAMVQADAIKKFEDAMRRAHVDYQIISYGGAVHSFTNPDADGSFSPNVKYNQSADRRSWTHMQAFLAEVLGGK